MRTLRILLAFALAIALPASAASHTWSGASNANWSVAGNWSAGGAPANAEAAVVLTFPAAQGNMGTMNNNRTGLNVTSMTFADTAYNLSVGNGFNLAGTISVTGGTNAGNVLIGLPITLNGTGTFDSTGGANAYFLSITGAIGETGGARDVHVQSTGATGEVFFTAANTYTGTTFVDSGYLLIQNAGALGTTAAGTVVATGATLSLNAAITVAGESLTVGGSGVNGNGALQMNNGAAWTGPITVTANTTWKANGTATLSGVISETGGSRAITFRASPAFILTQNNTYTGLSQIEYGTVEVDGAQGGSAFELSGYGGATDTSTLAGGGTVGAVAPGTGPHPKVVAPGPVAGGTAVLNTGNFSLNDTANGNHGKLAIDLNGPTPGTGYDQVIATGTVDVTGATLAVTLGYAPSVADTFVIVNNNGSAPVVGTFAGLSEGATVAIGPYQMTISYVGGTGNDITLTVTTTPVELSRFAAE